MLYYLLKALLWLMVQVYFRKVFFSGRERIPRDRPIVFAANHQSAFIEPTLFGSLSPVELHFITRGDVFVNKYLWFFRQTNQIPIFRFRDGFSGIRQNKDTMSRCYEVLSEGGSILIFAQPGMKWEKRIGRVQKGAARMATGAMTRYEGIKPVILPLGINYTDHTRLNSDVMIKVGHPLEVEEYTEQLEDVRLVEDALCEAIASQQKDLIVHIEDEEYEEEVEVLLQIKRNNFNWTFLPKIRSSDRQLQAEIQAAEAFNTTSEKSAWAERIREYDALLKKHRVTDYAVCRKDKPLFRIWSFFLLAPIALAGALLNKWPTLLAEYIARTKTSNPEFYSSIRFAAGGFLYMFYYILVVIIAFAISTRWGFLLGVLLPASGLVALYWQCRVKDYAGMHRLKGMSLEATNKLTDKRNKLNEKF